MTTNRCFYMTALCSLLIASITYAEPGSTGAEQQSDARIEYGLVFDGERSYISVPHIPFDDLDAFTRWHVSGGYSPASNEQTATSPTRAKPPSKASPNPSASSPSHPPPDKLPPMDAPPIQYARTDDGVSIAHVDSGEPTLNGFPKLVRSFVVGEGA